MSAFQSTRPRVGGQYRLGSDSTFQMFQSTRPRAGATEIPDIDEGDFICFNPRARVGRDRDA